MSKPSIPIDWQTPQDKPESDLRTIPAGGIEGYIATPHGYVRCTYRTQGDLKRLELSVIRHGIRYSRHVSGAVARRTLVLMANRFAKEIAERNRNEPF